MDSLISIAYLYREAINNFGHVEILRNSPNIKMYTIDDIKVGFVNYSYPWISEALLYDSIKLAQVEDIAAMKVSAITGRGTKKDFVDLYFLLQHFTLGEIFQFYWKKYSDASEYLALKSLSYFDDVEEDASPVMLETVKWEDIKKRIREEVIRYAQV